MGQRDERAERIGRPDVRSSGENVHRCTPARYEVRIRLKGTNPGLSAVIDYVFAARTINCKRETYLGVGRPIFVREKSLTTPLRRSERIPRYFLGRRTRDRE